MKTEGVKGKGGRVLPIVFRVFAFIFAAGGLFMLQGLSEGLEPWIHGVLASSPLEDELQFFGAVHGALIGLLFSGSLIAMLWSPLRKPVLLQFYFVGHVLFLLTLAVTDPALAGQQLFVFIMFGVVLLVLFTTYSKRRDIFRPSEPKATNRTLLILTGVALIALLPYMINSAIQQGKDPMEQFRWGEGVALGLTMLYGGYLASSARTGARTLGILLSAAYVFLGAAAITVSDHPGSWGLWGGIAAIVYGCIFGAAAIRSASVRSSVEASASVS